MDLRKKERGTSRELLGIKLATLGIGQVMMHGTKHNQPTKLHWPGLNPLFKWQVGVNETISKYSLCVLSQSPSAPPTPFPDSKRNYTTLP